MGLRRLHAWNLEVSLNPDLEAKLSRLAADLGSDTQALVQEAVERFADYDQWFLDEVEKGLVAADRGGLVDHDDIGKPIDGHYPG